LADSPSPLDAIFCKSDREKQAGGAVFFALSSISLTTPFFSLDSKSNTLILPWHTISTTTSIQEEAFLRKEELLISRDGISFCYKAGSLREYYYFAPQINERRFLEHVSSSLNIIKEEIKIFRKHSISLIQAVESNKTTTSEEK